MPCPTFSDTFRTIQRSLFPALEEELGELCESHRGVVETLEILDLPSLVRYGYGDCARGRPRLGRLPFLKAFVAKARLGMSCTRSLLDRLRHDPALRRLCGWEERHRIPSEATFSRVFAEFAETGLPERVQARLTARYASEQDGPACQVSYDSTDIPARESPADKDVPRLGMPPLEEQATNRLEHNLLRVPEPCGFGVKRKGHGHSYCWKGFKLHVAVTDGDIPVAAVVSCASLHDSQMIIPLMQKCRRSGLDWVCDLADSAYDAATIRHYSRSNRRIAIIDRNRRRGEKLDFLPHEKLLYKRRSGVERVFSQLKDGYGCGKVWVKGIRKVTAHLVFGLLALAGAQIARSFG
jgi:hypothetical protein